MYNGGHGGIGRHDGLKIRCLGIMREGSSPSVPIAISEKHIQFRFSSPNELYINTNKNFKACTTIK